MRRACLRTVVAMSLVMGCGGGDGTLGRDVTDLPDGNAKGTDATGSYRYEALTVDCSGKCVVDVRGISYSACDVGHRERGTIDVEQEDGRLVIDTDDSDYVSRLEGGVYADGSFEVGGLRTHFGGQVEVRTLALGTLDDSGAMESEVLAEIEGSGDGWRIDCRAEADLDAERRR